MQNSNPTPQRENGSGLKVLISLISLGTVISLWNLFSSKDSNGTALNLVNLFSPPSQPPVGKALDLPPLPTLVPVATLGSSPSSSQPSALVQNPLSQPTMSLREVGLPTASEIEQLKPPVVESANEPQQIPGGGSGSTNKPRPITKPS